MNPCPIRGNECCRRDMGSVWRGAWERGTMRVMHYLIGGNGKSGDNRKKSCISYPSDLGLATERLAAQSRCASEDLERQADR